MHIDRLISRLKLVALKLHYFRRQLAGKCPIPAVTIEISAHCHRRCVYCPVSTRPHPKQFMDRDLLRSILGQLSELGFDGKLMYHFYNEPLLNRDLENIAKLARKLIPNARQVIYTSGDQLTKKRARSLFRSGIRQFVVTDHGGSIPKTDYVQGLNSWPTSRMRYRKISETSALFNRGGLVEIKNRRPMPYCPFPANELVIDVNGDVLLCCNDYLRQNKFGNVNSESLLDIWNKRELKELRRRLLNGKYELSICKSCALSRSESRQNAQAKYSTSAPVTGKA